jgi:hypothetical protein
MLVSEKLIRITLKLIIGIAFITHKVIFKREKFIEVLQTINENRIISRTKTNMYNSLYQTDLIFK